MFGWEVGRVAGNVVIRDDDHHEQARFSLERDPTAPVPCRVGAGVTVVALPDGRAQIWGGRPYGVRRRSRDGQAFVRGRIYNFEQDSSRWMHITRDGWTIARLHRRRADIDSPVDVILRGEIDPTDQLVIVIGQECIRPGRPGVVGNVLGLVRRWQFERRARRGRIDR